MAKGKATGRNKKEQLSQGANALTPELCKDWRTPELREEARMDEERANATLCSGELSALSEVLPVACKPSELRQFHAMLGGVAHFLYQDCGQILELQNAVRESFLHAMSDVLRSEASEEYRCLQRKFDELHDNNG